MLLGSVSCRNTDAPLEAARETPNAVPRQKVERFSTQHTEAGVVKWTLVGDTSTFHGSYIEVENPTVQIFEEGVLSMTINSKKGRQFLTGTQKDNLHLTGDVVGVSEDGTLYSQILYWRNTVGRLYAPDEATIVRGDSTWIGTQMYANPTLKTVTMKNNQFELHSKDEKNHEYDKSPTQSQ